jgi:GNAT superfamily N-acetyltransferase
MIKGDLEMELEIRALSPQLLGDYLEFFDHVAFSDHPEWSLCYCMFYHRQSEWDHESEQNNRAQAIEYINGGLLKGYLAYIDGKVAGWCNANDKYNYAALASDPEICEPGETEKKVLSVVCFLVAPAFRGKGIATQLLERACADANSRI